MHILHCIIIHLTLQSFFSNFLHIHHIALTKHKHVIEIHMTCDGLFLALGHDVHEITCWPRVQGFSLKGEEERNV